MYRSGLVCLIGTTLFFLFAVPAKAQDTLSCTSLDADARIASCTRIISRRESAAAVATAYRYRCGGYNMKAEYDLAIPDCNYAIQYEANPVYAYTLRGAAWAGKRQLDRAMADYNRALQLASNNEERVTGLIGRAGVWR